MLEDDEIKTLDDAIHMAEEGGEQVLVWSDDGVIWIQIGEREPQQIQSSPETIIAYLIGGAVGTP